jgi:hypothetical protein
MRERGMGHPRLHESASAAKAAEVDRKILRPGKYQSPSKKVFDGINLFEICCR